MTIEVVEQLDTCIRKDNWPDYCRCRLLIGCTELFGTLEKLQEPVGKLEMVKEDHVVTVADKTGDVIEELQEALAKQDDEICLLKSPLGSDYV